MSYLIAVYGSGVCSPGDWARTAGAAVAKAGSDLLTGGGEGCMQAAIEGFNGVLDRSGKSYAIRPLSPNPAEELGRLQELYDVVIFTPFGAPKEFDWNPFSRNLVNVAFCHAAIFVSPTPGTLVEVSWMLKLRKPCAFLGTEQDWQIAQAILEEKVGGQVPTEQLLSFCSAEGAHNSWELAERCVRELSSQLKLLAP